MRTEWKALGLSAIVAAALTVGTVLGASAAPARDSATAGIETSAGPVAASAGIGAEIAQPRSEPSYQVADARSRRRNTAIAAGVAAIAATAIIASQSARAGEREVVVRERYDGPSRYQCRRWLRECDDGANWACRKFRRECE